MSLSPVERKSPGKAAPCSFGALYWTADGVSPECAPRYTRRRPSLTVFVRGGLGSLGPLSESAMGPRGRGTATQMMLDVARLELAREHLGLSLGELWLR